MGGHGREAGYPRGRTGVRRKPKPNVIVNDPLDRGTLRLNYQQADRKNQRPHPNLL
jgi:hypothetical protein